MKIEMKAQLIVLSFAFWQHYQNDLPEKMKYLEFCDKKVNILRLNK